MKAKKILFLTFFSLLSISETYAQSEIGNEDTAGNLGIYNSKRIDVSGHKNRSQQMADKRRKTEKKNNNEVIEYIERIRSKEEDRRKKKMNKIMENQLESVFDEGAATSKSKDRDDVETSEKIRNQKDDNDNRDHMSGSFASVTAKTTKKKNNRIAPYFGVGTIKGDGINFKTDSNFGITIESMPGDVFSLGAKINYSNLNFVAISKEFIPFDTTSKHKMKYDHFNISLIGKIFLLRDERNTAEAIQLRPFVGAGLGYNQDHLKYRDTSFALGYNGDKRPSLSSSYFSMSLILGTEIAFTESMGINIDFKLLRGLHNSFGGPRTSSSSSDDSEIQDETTSEERDQQRLEIINNAIQDANVMALNIGVVFKF